MSPSDELVLYSMDYVRQGHKLSLTEAKRFVLNPDPRFTTQMELFSIVLAHDPDALAAVQTREYDEPSLNDINECLDLFASRYASSEPEIMAYLSGLGHPLGNTGGKRGCLALLLFVLLPISAVLCLMR